MVYALSSGLLMAANPSFEHRPSMTFLIILGSCPFDTPLKKKEESHQEDKNHPLLI
jgi:hypothetical protein